MKILANLRRRSAWFAKVLPEPASPLPTIDLGHGPIVPALAIRILAAVLPFMLVLLMPIRLGFGLGATVTFLVFALILGMVALLIPSVLAALIAIGIAAVTGLARTPTFGWAIALAALGYLALRAGMLANQLPWSGLVSLDLLKRSALRDLAILAATAAAGGLGILAQRFTGCDVHGISIAGATQDVPTQVCHPAGGALVALGALTLIATALGLSTLATRSRQHDS